MQQAPFETARKNEQPVIGPRVLGPAQLPVGALSEKVVLPDALIERGLQHHRKEKVGGRVRTVSRIVPYLEQMDSVLVRERIIEGDSLRARVQEVQPHPAALRRSRCKCRIKFGNVRIAGNGGASLPLPGRGLQLQCCVEGIRKRFARSDRFDLYRPDALEALEPIS